MWRLWTRGWGPRAWWYWVTDEGWPLWVAAHLPRRVVFWCFIRVHAAGGIPPAGGDGYETYKQAYDAWESR